MEKMSKKYAEAQHQIKTLKIECKRRKQTIETQQVWYHKLPWDSRAKKGGKFKLAECLQECLLRGENLGSFQKCQLCGKTFVNLTFLDSHMARRHPDNRKKLDDDQQVIILLLCVDFGLYCCTTHHVRCCCTWHMISIMWSSTLLRLFYCQYMPNMWLKKEKAQLKDPPFSLALPKTNEGYVTPCL